VSEETAGWVGGWADGLVTVNQPREKLERMIAAFRENGGEGKRLAVQVHLSWAQDESAALAMAHDQWRTNVFPPPLCWDLQTVEQFDVAAKHVRPEDVAETVVVSSQLERHLELLRELAALGFDEIHLHHVGQDLHPFIDAFGEHVLPALAEDDR
jgi:alkanesulfonate monooxygenase SsuD/methylene tetrahydromethanopterin reductase-like flavin-dependent oxidoreductase (luciferase family)